MSNVSNLTYQGQNVSYVKAGKPWTNQIHPIVCGSGLQPNDNKFVLRKSSGATSPNARVVPHDLIGVLERGKQFDLGSSHCP